LGSVITQSLQDWEVVLVDDGSATDESIEIARSFGDPRIHTVRHGANRGISAARNTGIRNANAPLITLLDGDDKLAPTLLERLHTVLHGQPDHVVAYAAFSGFGNCTEGKILYPVPGNLRDRWPPGPGTMFRKALWEKVGGYSEDLSFGNEDWDFWLSAERYGLQVIHLPEPLYYYRQHGENFSFSVVRGNEYRSREVLLRRHSELKQRLGGRRAFLAEGYRFSAKTAWLRGRHATALKLALRAAWLGPIGFLHAAVRSVFPSKARKQEQCVNV
jgi:glycosyltransferase involved in cell wall biosynthesis